MDIIVGAGVSGIAYANFTKNPYQIFEQDAQIGGYCKTIKKSGFVWDYSGHFFHFRHPELEQFVCKNIDPKELYRTEKITQIYYKGRYIDFPFQSNIHQLEQEEFIDCLCDLFAADPNAQTTSFKEFVFNNLGRSIAEKFLVPYNEKLYACDLDTLDPDAMGRFFPKASREEIVKNFRSPSGSSYNATFTYPRGGAIQYIDSLMDNIGSDHLHTQAEVTQIDLEQKMVTMADGAQHRFDHLISTMPFTTLLDKCGVAYDRSIYTCNKVFVFNLGFDRKGADTKNCWVYFPEKKYSFYRIGYYDNIIPADRMSLYVEIGFSEGQAIPETETLLRQVLVDLAQAGVVTDQQLVDYHHVVMNPAYVHINKCQLADLEQKRVELASCGIYSIGRYGSWTYCSIEDNIIEARDLALKLNAE